MKILLVEDDQNIVESISIILDMRWPEAKLIITSHGATGAELVEKENPDIVILDLGLPDISGFEVLEIIRLFSNVPVIILTVRGEETDISKGLELGADDYVVKPFRQVEFLSRVRAVLRRAGPIDNASPIVCGRLHYYPATRQLLYGEKEISLTSSESHIFESLIKKAGCLVTHAELSESLFGDYYPEAADNIKVHIQRIRKKIEADPSHPNIIINKLGLGYILSKDN
jgi:DNA-binding response OmpR family regulator